MIFVFSDTIPLGRQVHINLLADRRAVGHRCATITVWDTCFSTVVSDVLFCTGLLLEFLIQTSSAKVFQVMCPFSYSIEIALPSPNPDNVNALYITSASPIMLILPGTLHPQIF